MRTPLCLGDFHDFNIKCGKVRLFSLIMGQLGAHFLEKCAPIDNMSSMIKMNGVN
jgi:hypothetical protein